MSTISPQDKGKLRKILLDTPLLLRKEGRAVFLYKASLGFLAPEIEKHNNEFDVIDALIVLLEKQPCIGPRVEALGSALAQLLQHTENPEYQNFIRYLISYYSLLPQTDDTFSASTEYRKLYSESEEVNVKNDFLVDIAFFEKILIASKAVVRIDTPYGTATGFLVKTNPNLVLTCRHVIRTSDILPLVEFTFYFEQSVDKNRQKFISKIRHKGLTYISNDTDLDFALIEIGNIPSSITPISLISSPLVDLGSRVYIIHHPLGVEKKVSIYHNIVRHIQDSEIIYTTPTEVGSSGAPVLNYFGQLVALHRAGRPENKSFLVDNYNYGVMGSKIYAYLPEYIRRLV